MDNQDALKGKRKKKVSNCPNTLFVYWLKELRDDAAEKGLKAQYTYGKALKSLQKYPAPLPNGKACKMLENFGDKICSMLDEKLDDHIQLYGSADFIPDEIAEKFPAARQSRARKRPAARLQAEDGENMAGAGPPNTQRKRATSGGREYLPQPGSGPYALIVTLFKATGEANFMFKQELMRAAQPLASKSFFVPDPGSRYTSWSSMGTLIRKGFVIKQSSPAHYSLTPAGVDLALKLIDLDGDQPDIPQHVDNIRLPARQEEFRLPRLPSPGMPDFPSFSVSPVRSPFTGKGSRLGSPLESPDRKRANHISQSPGVQPFQGIGHRLGSIDDDLPKGSPLKKCTQATHAKSTDDLPLRFVIGSPGQSSKNVSNIEMRRNLNRLAHPVHELSDSEEDEPQTSSFTSKIDGSRKAPCVSSQSNASRNHVSTAAEVEPLNFWSSDWNRSGLPDGTSTMLSNSDSGPEKSLKQSKKATEDVVYLSSDSEPESFQGPTHSSYSPKEELQPSDIYRGNVTVTKSKLHDISDSDDDLPELPSLASRLGQSSPTPAMHVSQSVDNSDFRFDYIGEEGEILMHKDKAAVTIDENLGGLGFLIKCSYTDLILSSKLYTLDNTKTASGGRVYAYVCDRDAPDKAPGLSTPSTAGDKNHLEKDDSQTLHGANKSSKSTGPIMLDDQVPYYTSSVKKRKVATSTITKAEASIPPAPVKNETEEQVLLPSISTKTANIDDPKEKWNFLSYKNKGSGSKHTGDSGGSGSTGSGHRSKVESEIPVDESPLFTLQPGKFDVILCVDKREHFGGPKSSKQLLMPELQKHNAKFELRQLQLGDFAWVARPKGAPEGEREIIFDHIVERKRMDDLASSIVDGRFTEQKDEEKCPVASVFCPDTSTKEVPESQQESASVKHENPSRDITREKCHALKSLKNGNETKKVEPKLIKSKLDLTSQATMDTWLDRDKHKEEQSNHIDHRGKREDTNVGRKEAEDGSNRSFDQDNVVCSDAENNIVTDDYGSDISSDSEQVLVDLCSKMEQAWISTSTPVLGEIEDLHIDSASKCSPTLTLNNEKSSSSMGCLPDKKLREKMITTEMCTKSEVNEQSNGENKENVGTVKKVPSENVQGLKQLTLADRGFDVPLQEKTRRLFKPIFEPAMERLPPEKYEEVFFDIEATGLSTSSHIVQLAASGPWGTFNRYVKPEKGMHPDAAAVTGIKYFKGRLIHNGRQVNAMPIEMCLKQFLKFLPKKKALLIGHNAHAYDSRVLFNAAIACGLEEELSSRICGFVDTLSLFREVYPDFKPKYSQVELVKHFLGASYLAHNAKADASVLKKLFRHCQFKPKHVFSHSISSKYVLESMTYDEKKKRRVATYSDIKSGVLSDGIITRAAGVGIRYKDITKAFRRGGEEAVHKLFSEPNEYGKPRVTKSKAVLSSLMKYLQENAD